MEQYHDEGMLDPCYPKKVKSLLRTTHFVLQLSSCIDSFFKLLVFMWIRSLLLDFSLEIPEPRGLSGMHPKTKVIYLIFGNIRSYDLSVGFSSDLVSICFWQWN